MLSYQETIDRLSELKVKMDAGTGNRSKLATEFMRLKRNLTKYPEHKEKKGSK